MSRKQTVNEYEGGEGQVYLYAILISALDGGEWFPRRFIPRKLAPMPTEQVRERASEWRSGSTGKQEKSLSLSANELCSLGSPFRSPHQYSCYSYLPLTDLPTKIT